MARRKSLSSQLFRAARIADDVEAAESGNPRRMTNRAKNVVVGRELRRSGFWRALWRSWGGKGGK
jgi:muconolactone delta-isomerase